MALLTLGCRTEVTRQSLPAGILQAGRLFAALLTLCLLSARALAGPGEYFVIRVVDEQTGRGVPLVELRTTNDTSWFTDSNGVVAFLEPGLMNRKVFFTITSPGYEYAADGFGMHGTALQTVPGARVTLKIKRINVAERLYRLTGAGIYRDTVLAGDPAPMRAPLLNGDVVGQDSVLAVPYRGAIRWFWGDTSRPDYPLGNFGMSGAISSLKLNPGLAIDYTYFTDASGFSRPMIAANGPGPVWITGVSPIENGSRLVGYFSRIETLAKAVERGLAVYNDGTDKFERVAQFDTAIPLPLDGHPFLAKDGSVTYLVGTHDGVAPLPLVRAPATLPSLKDLTTYEAYTCLKPVRAGADPQLDRDSSGKLRYSWKRGAPSLGADQERRLIAGGAIKPAELLCRLTDIETGKSVRPHGGSVYWNAFRSRWVMIFGQAGGGVSNVGEIWFSEADTPVGPWVYARKIATHPKMDFYNPTQHPFLDEDGGRRIYFEGTYVHTFSGNPVAIPRYNYNQILYRLALDDPRLDIPAPVYRLASGEFRMRENLKLPADSGLIRSIPFFAVSPARNRAGLIPIYAAGGELTDSGSAGARPLFYALPPTAPGTDLTTPLLGRDGTKLGLVWRNPQTILPLDFGMTSAPDPGSGD